MIQGHLNSFFLWNCTLFPVFAVNYCVVDTMQLSQLYIFMIVESYETAAITLLSCKFVHNPLPL